MLTGWQYSRHPILTGSSSHIYDQLCDLRWLAGIPVVLTVTDLHSRISRQDRIDKYNRTSLPGPLHVRFDERVVRACLCADTGDVLSPITSHSILHQSANFCKCASPVVDFQIGLFSAAISSRSSKYGTIMTREARQPVRRGCLPSLDDVNA